MGTAVLPCGGFDDARPSVAVRLLHLMFVLMAHGALAAWVFAPPNVPIAAPQAIRMDVRLVTHSAAPADTVGEPATMQVPAPESELEVAEQLVQPEPRVTPSVPERTPLPEPEPEPEPTPAPEPTPMPKPEPKPQPKPQPKPAPKLEPKPRAARDVAPAPAPAPVAPVAAAKTADVPGAADAAPSPMPAVGNEAAAPAFVEARFDADYLRNPPPVYPPMSRRRGEQGEVRLLVAVSATGLPERVEIRESSGYARLDEAAVRAVREWRFVPARRGDRPVAANVVVPVTFRLQG